MQLAAFADLICHVKSEAVAAGRPNVLVLTDAICGHLPVLFVRRASQCAQNKCAAHKQVIGFSFWQTNALYDCKYT